LRVNPDSSQTLRNSHYNAKGRLRRRIRELELRINTVIHGFRCDTKFITNEVLRVHQTQLAHIRTGCLSDHPSVPLYQEIREGSDTLLSFINVLVVHRNSKDFKRERVSMSFNEYRSFNEYEGV
jgi:hypothetical protein